MTSGHKTRYRVVGGNPLQGTVFVQGAKNAALKMIAASLLAEKGRTVLRNVPVIEDVRRAVELAQAVGAMVKFHEVERTLVVDASDLTSPILPADLTRQFRGSVLFVPALLHRLGEAVLGERGINISDWCQKNMPVSRQWLDRHAELHKHWRSFLDARRWATDTGYVSSRQSGLEYALELIMAKDRSVLLSTESRRAAGAEARSFR